MAENLIAAQASNPHLKNFDEYKKLYDQSIENPKEFFKKIANENLSWIKDFTEVHNNRFANAKWFADGKINVSENCIDRHLKDRSDKVALIWEGDEPGNSKSFTFKKLHEEVCSLSNVLKNLNVSKGSRVCIYMPMIPEAAFAMLACTRIGAIHSVVFGGFASNELASRIDDSKAKILVTASCGFEPGRTVEYKPLVDKALELSSHKIEKVIFFQRPGNEVKLNTPRDIDWDEALSNAQNTDCVEMNSNDYAYILYTSGTTGIPKGIVRDIGAVSYTHLTLPTIYSV